MSFLWLNVKALSPYQGVGAMCKHSTRRNNVRHSECSGDETSEGKHHGHRRLEEDLKISELQSPFSYLPIFPKSWCSLIISAVPQMWLISPYSECVHRIWRFKESIICFLFDKAIKMRIKIKAEWLGWGNSELKDLKYFDKSKHMGEKKGKKCDCGSIPWTSKETG